MRSVHAMCILGMYSAVLGFSIVLQKVGFPFLLQESTRMGSVHAACMY